MPDLARSGVSNRAGVLLDPSPDFLVFCLAEESYGIELARISEIVSFQVLTDVPRSPEHVMGIFSNRGVLVTVLDLRSRLGLSQSAPGEGSRVLLSRADSGELMGLFVDEVRHVVRLASSQVEAAESVFGGDLSAHVLGIGRPDGEPIILLDALSITSNV